MGFSFRSKRDETSTRVDKPKPTSICATQMRGALLLLITALPFSTGCSAYIAGAGKDLSGLQTREQVHAEFGAPVAAGTVEGREYEDFRTRRKIAEKMRAQGLGMGFAMTFGVFELAFFPIEVATVAGRTISGQTLRFCYDSSGRVSAVYLNGESLSFLLSRPLPASDTPTSEGETTPSTQKQP